jgi:hypothetical protein
MLLAEELALIAVDPDSGRHALGVRNALIAATTAASVAALAGSS